MGLDYFNRYCEFKNRNYSNSLIYCVFIRANLNETIQNTWGNACPKSCFFLEILIFYASSQSFGGINILNSFLAFFKPHLEIVFGRILKWDPNLHGRSSSATRHSEDFQKHHWKSAESLHLVHIQIYTIENQLLAFAPAVPMWFGSLHSLHYNHDICCGGVRLTENFPH